MYLTPHGIIYPVIDLKDNRLKYPIIEFSSRYFSTATKLMFSLKSETHHRQVGLFSHSSANSPLYQTRQNVAALYLQMWRRGR